MTDGTLRLPTPFNEPVRNYVPGSPERASIKRTLARMMADEIEIPPRTVSYTHLTLPTNREV